MPIDHVLPHDLDDQYGPGAEQAELSEDTELDIVLASYRDMFGVKTERGNELHKAACIEVWELRNKAQDYARLQSENQFLQGVILGLQTTDAAERDTGEGWGPTGNRPIK